MEDLHPLMFLFRLERVEIRSRKKNYVKDTYAYVISEAVFEPIIKIRKNIPKLLLFQQ